MTPVEEARGYELWTPEPRYAGHMVFVLGGGPSLAAFDVERLHGRVVIAVNASLYICPWADLFYFTDHNFWTDHRAVIDAFSGMIVTADRHAKAEQPERLRRIEGLTQPDFTHENPLKFGRTSGHTAISLAIAMGAARVVLLGFDMRRVDGRSHWHDYYPSQDDKLFSHDFLIHFRGWNEAALRAGVDVVNCTSGSALEEFRKAQLDDILEEVSLC
jgi:hypothetical protein